VIETSLCATERRSGWLATAACARFRGAALTEARDTSRERRIGVITIVRPQRLRLGRHRDLGPCCGCDLRFGRPVPRVPRVEQAPSWLETPTAFRTGQAAVGAGDHVVPSVDDPLAMMREPTPIAPTRVGAAARFPEGRAMWPHFGLIRPIARLDPGHGQRAGRAAGLSRCLRPCAPSGTRAGRAARPCEQAPTDANGRLSCSAGRSSHRPFTRRWSQATVGRPRIRASWSAAPSLGGASPGRCRESVLYTA
jgi:hypothetical protein